MPTNCGHFLIYGGVYVTNTIDELLQRIKKSGDVSALKKLIHLGFDINKIVEENGQNLLLLCVQEDYFDCVRLLLENGADVNAVNDFHNNAFILSIAWNETSDIANILVEYGIDFNLESQEYEPSKSAVEIMIENYRENKQDDYIEWKINFFKEHFEKLNTKNKKVIKSFRLERLMV
jgi:ankyrin repeat protein